MKKRTVIAVILSIACLLSGCGSTASDYQSYIKGSYDVIYKGEFKDYQDTTDATEEESREQYQLSVAHYVESFAKKFNLDLTRGENRKELEAVVPEILKLLKYEVMPAQKKDDTYYVEVKVEPLEYIDPVMTKVMTLKDDLESRMESGEVSSEEEYTKEYEEGVLKILKEEIENVSYGEEESFSIPIQVRGNSYYAEHNDLLEVSDYLFKNSI